MAIKTVQEFKKTPAGKIPVDWTFAKGGMIFNPIKGKPPSVLVNQQKSGYLPYVSNEYLRENTAMYAKPEPGAALTKENDIILLWDGSNAGEVFLAKPGILSSTMSLLEIGDERKFEKKYIYYALKYKEATLQRTTKGTGIPHVDGQLLTILPFAIPPLSEQEKIAAVLSSVDEAMSKTQKTIEQTQTLKKSLLQILFTRGLPGKHKRFKKSEIGPIPADWDLRPIDEVCDINPSQSEISGAKDATKVTFMPMECVRENAAGIGQYLEKEFGEVKTGYTYFANGDILFAKITPCMENGKTAVAKNLKNGIGFGSTEFHVLRPNTNGLLPEFVFHWVSRKVFRSLAKTYFTGTAGQQRVQKWFFSYVSIPIPPIEEQKAIVNLLSQVDNKIQRSKAAVEGLVAVKKALMQALLTGKVRVSL